jgi:multidrug resistance protein
MTSMASFFSPLSGQIYYPVLPILTQNYQLTPELLNVTITTYMIFQGLAPSFMGAFSDASGRRLGYILAFTIYTFANIGLALQNSFAALLVPRCLQSAGSSGTIAFGYGVIADVTTTGERGKFFGPMLAGALTAPALGPTIGGLLAQFLGWRAVFWFLTIISGTYLVAYTILMPETSRKIVGDGSVPPTEWWRMSLVQYLAARRKLKQMSPDEREKYEQTR